MLASLLAAARRGVGARMYGRAERMSSTCVGAALCGGSAAVSTACSLMTGSVATKERFSAERGPAPFRGGSGRLGRVSDLEQLSERYAEHHRSSREPDFVYGGSERAQFFRRVVGGPGRRVLDIGCRSGALTREYADGNDVVGIDVDRDALEEAGRTLGIETAWADVDHGLPFESESFDVVVAGEVLEHVRFPDRVTAEAHRVLRPGGTLVGSVPNAVRFKNRLRFAAGRRPERNPTHFHLFTPGDVRSLLAGFDDVELTFVTGRFVALHPRLMANNIFFSARRPS